MGIACTKPATLEALNKALDPIKQDLEALTGALLVPNGDAAATTTTVQIQQEGHTLGHGLVVVGATDIKNDDTSTFETVPIYYLISAAHVLVCVKPNTTLLLSHQSREIMTAQVGELYLSPSYVKHGMDDIAVLSLRQVKADSFQLVDFHCASPDVGTSVVAHGRSFFLRGTITLIHNDGPFTVFTHFVPQSRGSPLFDNRKALVGLVHGGTKHRGKHVNKDHQHASIVYCYSLVDGKLWPTKLDENKQRCLELAEDVPEGLANRSDSLWHVCKSGKANDLETLARYLQFTINQDTTLDDLMGELARYIWPLPSEKIFSISTNWKMATWSDSCGTTSNHAAHKGNKGTWWVTQSLAYRRTWQRDKNRDLEM